MASTSEVGPGVWLDHFVVAIDDLETGIEAFEALSGVRPVYGGEHPALGTHNALVSLGRDHYLEIVAPRPGAQLDPMFGAASAHSTLTPILWALATDDIGSLHAVATSTGLVANEPGAGSRLTDDGETIRWTMFVMGDVDLINAPFFLQWDPGTTHPAASSPAGCRLQSFAIATPTRGRLELLLTSVGFPLEVDSGPVRMMISLATPRGIVTLGG
ncbi:MAG TPA: VOC family protein [Acidobacteriota bacterium]|nr:VOC family protein [Acidobacteriota bacterium]